MTQHGVFTITFDGAGLAMGDLTRVNESLAVRVIVPALQARPLHGVIEVRGPDDLRRMLVGMLAERYHFTIRQQRWDGDAWSAELLFHDVSALRDNMVFDVVLGHPELAEAGIIYVEGGIVTMRINARKGVDAAHAARTIREDILSRGHSDAFVRVIDVPGTLHGWRSLMYPQ